MPRVKVALNPPQRQALDALKPGHTVCIPWGRGVGKSHFIRLHWWLRVAEYDRKLRTDAIEPFTGVRIIALMPTLKQFKAVHGAAILDEVNGKWRHLGGTVNQTDWSVKFPGGSWIRPFPAKDHTAQAARGMRCDIISCDEVDDIEPDVYDSVATPWLSEPWSLAEELAGGTPRRGRSGLLYRLHREGLSEDPEDSKTQSFHATYADAPGMVSADRVARAKRRSTKAVFEREWECSFDAGEGMVYPFDEAFHVRTPPPTERFSEMLLGVDHGWADPGVFLLCGIEGHGNDAVLWVLREHYETEKPNAYWNDLARKYAEAGVHTAYVDRSRPDRIADLRKEGLNAVGADNDIQAGIARLTDLMVRRPGPDDEFTCRLFVAPECANTIWEMGRYRRKKDPRDPDRYLEDPVDKDNHAMDSLRYLAVMRFGRLDGPGKTVVSGA